MKPVHLTEKLQLFTDQWSPKVIAEMNDTQFKLAKLEGEFVWHAHEDTDEVFFVVKGQLTMQLRTGNVEIPEGALYVVPKGVEHCPLARTECHVMIVEPRGVVNTGDAGGAFTAPNDVSI